MHTHAHTGDESPGMLELFRALLTAIFWHKTPAHYRRPDHLRLHESRQVGHSCFSLLACMHHIRSLAWFSSLA